MRTRVVLAVQEGPGNVVFLPAPHWDIEAVVAVGDKPHEIEVAPDNRTAFVSNFGVLEANHKEGTPGETISVIDLQMRRERARWELPKRYLAPHGLKLRPPDHRELFTNTEVGHEAMLVLDSQTGHLLRTFDLPHGVHNFVWDAMGKSLYAFTLTGSVLRLDPETGALLARVDGLRPRGLTWTSKFQTLVASGKGEVVLLDPETLNIQRSLSIPGADQIFYPALSHDGEILFAPGVIDGDVFAVEMRSGRVLRRVATGSPLIALTDAEGDSLWISNVRVPAGMFGQETPERKGGLTKIDLESWRAVHIAGVEDVNGIALLPT